MLKQKRKRSKLHIFPALILSLLTVIFAAFPSMALDENGLADSLSDFSGRNLTELDGSVYSQYVRESEYFTENETFLRYATDVDCVESVENGKSDAYLVAYINGFEYVRQHDDLMFFPQPICHTEYAFMFRKGDPLRDEFNRAMAELKAEGLEDILKDKWFNEDVSKRVLKEQDWVGAKGTLKYWVNVGPPPMAYTAPDGSVTGYSVDFILYVAERMGYNVEITECFFDGIIPALVSGYSDIAGRSFSITPERAEVVDFSDPFIQSDLLLIVRKNDVSPSLTEADSGSRKNTDFLSDFKTKFNRTFVRDNRWRLFLSGIGTTLQITLISAIAGTILGYLYYRLFRKKIRFLNPVLATLNHWIIGTPVVVLLMILYYVVFKKTDLAGTWIAIVCFSLIFSISVMELLNTGAKTIDKGQYDGALALGFTDRQAFNKILMPQIVCNVIPIYRSRITEHLKATAIVGYIAVQDLTKMTDLVRNLTFDAFFPLITTAIIYLVLGFVLNKLLTKIESMLDPEHNVGRMLKGVAK